MLNETRKKATVDDEEKLSWRAADVARCWIKYGVVILEASKVGLRRLIDYLSWYIFQVKKTIQIFIFEHEKNK